MFMCPAFATVAMETLNKFPIICYLKMPFFYVCNPVNSKKSIVFVFSLTCHRIGLFGPQSTLSPCPCEARHEFSNHMAGSAILGVY